MTVPDGAERACRIRLATMGATFEEEPPVQDDAGCGIARPLRLTALSRDVSLEPAVVVNCAVAEATARLVRDVVAPAARSAFGEPLVAVRQVSGYVCRPRNGGAKLSEHAFGNAIDLSGFELADGRVVAVEASRDRAVREFLRHVRGRACGPFRTVLGPGSDTDHADHLHLDLAPRRGGATFCQ